MGIDNRENSSNKNFVKPEDSNSIGDNQIDELLDRNFEDFLKSQKGREVLDCFDKSIKKTDESGGKKIGNFSGN